MKNRKPLGTVKKHHSGYEYLSLFAFPDDIKEAVSEDLIQKANHAQFLLGKLSGITILLPDVDYFISSYITKDATSSSQIEGTKATMIDAFEYSADPQNSTSPDADDIAYYIKALNYGLELINKDTLPISLRFIKTLHKELMEGARSSHSSSPGEFRTSQNWIGGTSPTNAIFVPPAPTEITEPLKDLENFIHNPYTHPVLDAGLLHAQFETIHPFLDGNGRTGRLLITFYLIHHKYLELPVLFLSSYFKKHQKVYYQRLAGYHDGEIHAWLDFFLDAVIETAVNAIEVSKKITTLRDQDLEKISSLSIKSRETGTIVLKNLYRNPVVSSAVIESWTGFSRQGTFKLIDKLVDVGILELRKKGEGTRSSTYIHRKYVDIFVDK